jgi:hypothetical protein
MWYFYTMEFYSAMKNNEILPLARKWMEMENIILSEVSQAQKTKNHMLPVPPSPLFSTLYYYFNQEMSPKR